MGNKLGSVKGYKRERERERKREKERERSSGIVRNMSLLFKDDKHFAVLSVDFSLFIILHVLPFPLFSIAD